MDRAPEEMLAQIHGEVAQGISELINSDHPNSKVKGLELALKFLKDNHITTQIGASPETERLAALAHDTTREDLEKLMQFTPDDA